MQIFISRASLLTLIAAALLPGLQIDSAAEEAPKAKARIEQPEFDYGAVPADTKVKHEFAIYNDGSGDLIVQRLVPSCGCTAATISAEPIKPGESGKISVEFDTAGFSGHKLKTIRVYTNDTDQPSLLLTLKGVIQPDVLVEPSSLIFEDVVRGSSSEQTSRQVTVQVREGSAIKIAGIRNSSKLVLINEIESTPQLRRLSVSISPEAPLGELRERVIIELRDSRQPAINLPIFAMVQGQLVLKPSQLAFGVIEGTDELIRSVRFDNRGALPVNIKEIRTDNPAVTAEFKPIEPGKKYVIQVKVDPAKVIRDLRASVEIITDSAEEGSVSLNVYGILPPKI